MRIQETLSNCCQSVSQSASTVATWTGHQVSVAAEFLGETWQKVSAFMADAWQKLAENAGPMLSKARNFAVKNQASILVGVIGAIIGGAFVAAYNACHATTPAVVPPQTV